MSIRQSAFSLLRRLRSSHQKVTAASWGRTSNALIQTGKMEFCSDYGFGRHTRKNQYREFYLWIFLSGQAVILCMNSSPALAEDVSVEPSSEKDLQGTNLTSLRKIEDGSVISNIHTSKWRVFTDSGRNFFVQGKLEEAEKLFLSALEEAKEGFGEKDPHVASAYNNLAELYRVKKVFDKAEPLYLEAVKILEESFGQEDIRVGASLHNLGQFYLVQRKLEKAHTCYERALKIKRRVLGHDNTDYADTMYHLGIGARKPEMLDIPFCMDWCRNHVMKSLRLVEYDRPWKKKENSHFLEFKQFLGVLHLQGKEKDSESLIQDSIRIMEEGGQGESSICLRRLRYLAQMYMKSNKLAEAENVQRKVLHIMELSKGWNSLDTVIAAEGLGLTLQSAGNLREAKDLLERCLEARKTILSEDHIQVASNMLYIARVEMLNSNLLRKMNTSEAVAELDKAKVRLVHSLRIAQKILNKSAKQEDKQRYSGVSRQTGKDEHAARVILLQSLDALGSLEITKKELLKSKGEHSPAEGAEDSLQHFISAFNMFRTEQSMSIPSELKPEYLSWLKNFSSLISSSTSDSMRRELLGTLKDEIKRVEGELPRNQKRRG